MAQQSENWIHCRHHSKAKVNWAANISAAVRSEKRYRVFHAASLFLTNLFFRFPPFNFLSLIFLLRSEWRKRKLKEIWICAEIRYYNSKYIDAEETDVSRNQTSTWLMKAEVVSKEEIYSVTNLVWLSAISATVWFEFHCGCFGARKQWNQMKTNWCWNWALKQTWLLIRQINSQFQLNSVLVSLIAVNSFDLNQKN